MEDLSRYAPSPAHLAVARHDHAALRRIISSLPRLSRAVILRDPISADILMAASADWSLQNEHGWSAIQEAVCTRKDAIALIMVQHHEPLSWAKWCRRIPRFVSSAARIRDFYMEITFHFESSVIPFIGRIAPSDTNRIWKRGSNLRADMTLDGFDGFRIQRTSVEYDDLLTAEERMQLDSALRIDGICEDEEHGLCESRENGSVGAYHENKKNLKTNSNSDDPKLFNKFSKECSNQRLVDQQNSISEYQ
ncbi:Ankyrin repeat domain-containing protein [Quillaja saponaria]|uniref:Ankyrin repeat domain-containing protein n=1 Tax=Quillaja saponaria TaxID=32244 RepID=A0AAD7QAY5_QUISA|nr:Ankyrin repeat domain-containing protein [Quillaja saponaria]